MKFQFTLVYDTDNDNHANVLGEMFRNEFFNQDEGEFGCYSTFELRPDVFDRRTEKEIIDEEGWHDEIEWTVASKYIDNKLITMRYYWDGDGYLSFVLPNGIVLANSDCKKSYRWEW